MIVDVNITVSNDTPASSDNSNDSFDNFVSNDTNDTEEEAEDSAENTGNTLDPVNPVASSPDGKSEDAKSEAGDGGSESIAVLTTRLTSDHHLIATLSISGVMGADVAVFPASVTGHSQENNNNATPDSAGGNIYTVSNVTSSAGSAGSYPAVSSSTASSDNAEKPDSLRLNFENEEDYIEAINKLQKKKSFSNEQQKIKPNTKNQNTKKVIEEIKEVAEYQEEQKKTKQKKDNKDEDDLTKGGRIMIFNMGK